MNTNFNNSLIVSGLLADNRDALRILHDVLGFDFESPFKAAKIEGKYTVNKILQTVAAQNCGNTTGAIIAVLTRDNNPYRNNKDLNLCTVTAAGIKIDYKIPWYGNRRRTIDNFYTKKSFEEIRKTEKAETFIIWQDRQYIKKPVEKPVDLSARFKYVSHYYCYSASMKEKYVNRVELRKTDEKGSKYTFEVIGRVFYAGSNYPTEINQVIDKSGYLLRDRRANLKRRAAALKAEHEKAAYNATENGGKVQELQTLIIARKAQIVKQLDAAQTSAEFEAVEKALARWRGFAGIVADFERFKEKTENKSYTSCAASDQAYNAIKAALSKGIENDD